MKNLFEGFEGVKVEDTSASSGGDPFAGFEGVKIMTPSPTATAAATATVSVDPASKFAAMLGNPQGAERLQKLASDFGTTVDDPQFQRRVQNPLNFSTYTSLMQLADTGNPDEVDSFDTAGNATGLGLKAALHMFGSAGGVFRKRNDALISRVAADQPLEVGDTFRSYKKIEDMTRAEQDATVPKEVLDIVNQNDNPTAPMDAATRAKAIYEVAKAGAMSREQMRRSASEELSIREELTGKTGGLLERAGVLAAKGMPTVGYGNTFLVGAAMGGIGALALPAVVSGSEHTSAMLGADIDPDTGKVLKKGAGYDEATARGYAYGGFEAASEIYTGKVLGLGFKVLDKATGGYLGKAVSKGLDVAAQQLSKTAVGRGIADFAKGVQRIAGLSALENPLTEYSEEGMQEWDERVFASRPSDNEVPVYAMNEATGRMEQTGTRQTSIGERTKEFNDRFYTWDNMAALAEGFALQYALTLGGGAMHAVQNRETSATVNKALLASGATNADLIRMSDEQKADAFNKFYGDESNRAEFAKTFKDAGDMLSASAQRMQEAGTWDKLGSSQKPTFEADIAKETEAGAQKIDDEKSGLSVEHSIAPEGEAFTVSDRDGNLKPVTVGTAEEAQAAAERMSQLKQGREIDMTKRAEIAQNVANVFAPGRNLILVQNDADMQRAAADEGVDPAQYKPGNPGITTPNGSIVVNVAAVTGFDHMVYTIKHETGHSVGDESGLNSLMKGKSVGAIGQELQKAGVLPKGVEATTAFRKDVETVREKYAAQGVKLTDAGAAEEVLSTMQEGLAPVIRKRFGDGLVNVLSKKGATAENMADARRIVANIMHSGKAPEVTMYGGKDAWATPSPAFTGDPLAQTSQKQAVQPAQEAPAPAPVTPVSPAAEPVHEAATPPAAKSVEAAPEGKVEIPAPVEEKNAPAAPKEKKIFKSEAEFTDYATSHPGETAQWTDSDFEIAPNPEPAKSDAAQISPTSEAGRGEALPESTKEKPAEKAEKPTEKPDAVPYEIPDLTFKGVQHLPGMADQHVWHDEKTGGTFFMPADATKEQVLAHAEESRAKFEAGKKSALTLDGGKPSDIEADKAKTAAQRKKQEERDEIAKKAAAPLEGGMGDTTPPLPGMEGAAPDDLALLNYKPNEKGAENAVQKPEAAGVDVRQQAGNGKGMGEGNAQGGKPSEKGGGEEVNGLPLNPVGERPQVAEKNAEVEFDRPPAQGSGRFNQGGEYVEIPGISVGGKRTYLNHSKRGNANVFYVSSAHQGKVLNGMAALMRVKGASEAVSGVKIIGGGAAPAGSEKWGVGQWATHNQKLVNRYEDGAKAAPKTPSTPKSDTKVPEAVKVEQPKAEVPVAPAPKMRFTSEDEMMRYVTAHPEETGNWTGDEFEIVPGETAAASASEADTNPAVPVAEEFVPPKKQLGEPKIKYNQRVAAARMEWDAAHAEKVESPVAETEKAAPVNAKDTEEDAEGKANAETQARVRAIPDAEYNAAPALAAMDAEIPAYESRKASSTRTPDSKERQAYSTPPPLAAIGAEAARDAATIIEPTAGNGGLLAPIRLDIARPGRPSPRLVDPPFAMQPDNLKTKVLANELDPERAKRLDAFLAESMGAPKSVYVGDYASTAYLGAIQYAKTDGKRAFLMNPPFGPTDESGLKLEHRIALKTIESAVPGDSLFFIGAAPGRDAMTMLPGALAGAYTSGAFAKFHSALNAQGWKAQLHFIADGALYRKMGAAFPVEVLLMKKTDGKEMNTHMPMRDLPARYSTWEQIRAAVADIYDPGAATSGERVANALAALGEDEKARAEAGGNAEASSQEINAARVKETAPDGAPRYKLSQDIELGLVTPDTSLTLNPFMLGINAKVWDKEFAGKVHNPTQLAESILSMPPEIEEARIKVADAIAKHLESGIENAFHTDLNYVSMGPALREAFEARWNATRPSDVEEEADRAQVNYHPLSNYKPKSQKELLSVMKMPVELAGGMSTALDAFGDRHPDGIDAFVAERLHWTPAQEADGRLDGSQIDTLGLAIEKIDDGTGFIVGSQTGSGKGRVMASVMDYHVKNGRIPIFLTAQAKLFTDIWGDITAVGAKDNIRPLVLNDYKAPKADADGEEDDEDAFTMPVFYAPVQRAAALSEGKLPKGANAIFLTYSQVQNPTESTRRKIALIESLLASGKGALVMDEAHLAAGADSNRGAILRHLTDIAKPGVVFSSATFAKRGENMTLYKRAGYAQFFKNDDEMEQALVVGGVPFQQYLAARLTERGFYIRHELDYEGVKFDKLTTIDTLGTPQERTTLSQREEQIADVYNQVVRTVMRFGATVKAINSRLQKGAPGANMDGAAFMSSLHNTASFIYTALKAETVANAAVKALREGRAPVVTLYNTNQSLLTEIGIGQNADVGRYLTRIAQRAVSIQMPDGSSASILTPTGYAQLVALVKEQDAAMLQNTAHSLVRQAESAADYLREQNLPASPIDRVRETVEKAGFNFAEVTGRTLMVQNGVVVRRIKPNPDTVIHAFNNSLTPDGKPNTVLLLNSSGATGLSAHASAAFKNQARREMLILQPSWDINEMMQMFGRVNRKAQVSKPIYHLVFTSAAGEQRNAAILMAKLRSLSANTSGVSKAGYGEEVEDALDFMNAFGDKALAELAAERNPVVASINALRASTAIRPATSISQFLPVREQEQFIGQIQAKVAALQDNAREAGLHDLEAGDIGRVPLTVEQLLSNSAMRAYEVPVLGRGKILTASEAVEAAQAWQAKHPTMLDDAKAKIDKAIADTSNPWLKRIYGDTAQVLEHALDSIGQVYYVRDDVGGGRRWFVPIEAHLPPSGTAQTASDWRVKVSFNTIRGVTTIPLSIFADKILSNAAKSSERNYNETLTRKEDRTIIAGDVAKALIGNIVSSGANGASQIVRARPVDGNFASFVLMMPRGVTVSSAKRIASSRLEPVTDVRDILPVSKNGWLEIDAGRVRVTPTYDSVSGDINGAAFGFRLATPTKARSKGISVAQIMRTAGAESRLKDAADSQGYVTGQYLSVEDANKALADLAKLSPYLQASQIVSDSEAIGGQEAVPDSAPRYRLADAPRLIIQKGQARYKLSDPVLIGELRTQSQLENAAEPGFRILEHIRGSKIVVPWNFREKGEYDWYKEMGEYTGFTKMYSMETWNAMIKRPDVANPKAHGNMDTLAKELDYDDVNEFAAAFLAELDRSKAMYEEQKARREHRQGMISAATESSLFKGKTDIAEVMGKAIEAVAQSLPADEKETIAQIETHEGEEAVRDYILRQYQEQVFLDMVERYALDGRNDERPDNIQLDDYYDRPEPVDKEGRTAQVFQQTHARLREVAATLPMVQPQKGPSNTEEGTTEIVRKTLRDLGKDAGGRELRDAAEMMIFQRLTGRRDTALTPEQNAIMLWYFKDLNDQRKTLEIEGREALRTNNRAMMNDLDTENNRLQEKTIDYINAKFTYGTLAGQALESLKRRVDNNFDIVKIYHQAMEESGGHISAERFRALQERVDSLEKKWADYVDALEMPDEEKGLAEKIADLEAKLADLNANHDTLKAETAELAKKRTALEAEHAKQFADANALSEKKAQLQAKIDNLESEIAFRSSLNQDIKELQAKVDALTKRMTALDAEYAGATPEFLASLEAQLADLTKQYAEKQAKYEKAQEALKTALERLARVRKMLEKLPKKISGTLARRRAVLTEAANLYGVFKAEMEKAQVERLAARWRGANPISRAKIAIAVTRDMIRGLQSMGDESVAGRQLAKLGLAHPILWARAFAQSQQLVFHRSGEVGADGHLLTWAERSDREMFELDQLMREHPLFDVLVRKGGLSWMDLTADPQSFDEQQTPIGALLRAALPRWTGVGAYTALLDVSNNHYAGMSNMLRFAAAAQLYEKMNVAKGETPTDSDVHAIVGIVDIFGGRGDNSSKGAKNFLAAAGHFMYSPRLALSNVQFFTRMAGIAGLNTEYGARARAMMATEYLRLGAMYATISILARMISKMFSDDPDEQRFQFKPGHTAFLQIMMGQRRLDLTGGAAMWARSVASILGIGDKLSTETGMVLQGEDARQNLDDSAVMRLLRSKLDPWTGMLWDVVKGKTYNGQAAGPRAKPNFPDYGMRYPNILTGIAPVPLTFQSLVDLLRGDVEQGIAPLHNPLLILDSLGAQFLGTGANSLPINSEIAQEVADGNLRNAQKLEKLNRQQQAILSDKKKSPEFKELRAQRIQDKLDALRGL